jgi:hypothetical protein
MAISIWCVGRSHNLADPASARLFVFQKRRWRRTHVECVRGVRAATSITTRAQVVDIDRDGDLDIVSIGWSHQRLVLYENKAIDRGTTNQAAVRRPGAARRTARPTRRRPTSPLRGQCHDSDGTIAQVDFLRERKPARVATPPPLSVPLERRAGGATSNAHRQRTRRRRRERELAAGARLRLGGGGGGGLGAAERARSCGSSSDTGVVGERPARSSRWIDQSGHGRDAVAAHARPHSRAT